MATIQDLGKVAYFNKGAYNSETNYEVNDVVSFNGSSYVSMVNNNRGNLPTNTNYWSIVALKGDKGDTGKAFVIEKTYQTIEEMVADYDNMNVNDYVMISGSIEDEKNATLWTKTETEVSPYKWVYLADFSGASGITGATPNIQIGTVTEGNQPAVTRRGTNENPIFDFVLKTGAKGDTGETGNGISSITKTGTSGLVDTYTVTYTNGNNMTFDVTNGNGIYSIVKTSTSGSVDTYTITYTNGNTSTFDVKNGEVTQEAFDALKEDVEDLRDNQIISDPIEGSEISVSDAAKARVYEFGMSKESTQDGTPTPDYPQEVKTVKGYRNEINLNRTSGVYSGNGTIFEESKYYPHMVRDSGNVGATGEMVSYTDNILTIRGRYEQGVGYPIKCKPNQNYFIKTTSTSANARLWVSFYDNTGTYISGSAQNTALERTVTAPNNAYWIIPIFAVSESSFSNISFNQIMVFESNQEHPYVSYGNNYVDVKVIGKNLFNKNNATSYYLDKDNGNLITSSATKTSDYIKVNSEDSYVIKGYNTTANYYKVVCFYNNNKEFISSINATNNLNTYIFTTPNNTKYLRFHYPNSSSNSIQIEEGSVATPYKPYQETNIPIPLNGNEIAGKGTNLDEYIVDKNGHCYLNKVFNKIDSYNGETITTDYWSTTGGLDTGATVYYLRDNPDLIDLNYTVDLRLFKGVNNITNSENADMKIRYVESIDSVINELRNAILEIGGGE